MSRTTLQKITSLNRTTLESLNEKDYSEILKHFTETGLEIVEADFGFAWWRSLEEGEYSLVYKSPNTPYNPNPPRQQGGNNTAQETKAPFFVHSTKQETYEPEYDVTPYMESYVIIPIVYKDNIYGNIVLCFKTEKNFSEDDKAVCTFIGNAAAQAITIHRLMKDEQDARIDSEKQRLRFRALIENSYDVIALLNDTGAITDISSSVLRMTGYEVSDLLGHSFEQFIHEEDKEKLREYIRKALEQPNTPLCIEVRYRHIDGQWHWLEANGVNKLSEISISGIILNIRDITQRKESESTIREQALRDPLTGIANRQEFALRFEQAMEQAKRNNRQLAVMFLDMDRFKNVNDRLGHNAGDTLLKVVASRLSATVRGEDVAARFGGDEFLILVNDIFSSKDAVVAAEKILKSVNLPVQIGEHTLHPSVSIGIAIYPHDGLELEGLKKNADIALYRAKENGKNRFSLYDHSLNGTHQAERFTLENELREALLNNEITIHYQPIVSLKKNKLVAVEALARWNHPTRGVLLPSEFIPLAEESGFITELDKFVLKRACLQRKEWTKIGLPEFRVAVNLSAQHFSQPEFVSGVANVLTETGAQPHELELEIIESLAMDNLELTSMNLDALKKLGVHITIDDFGTGYSSLNYLKKFPIHGLKIDKSFVRHCITNSSDTSITRTIVAMAQTLNLKVVAEGVEDAQQMSFLRSLGCDAAQGFFIAKPMPTEEFPVWFYKTYQDPEITNEHALVKEIVLEP